jgi:hypothetical protein
MGTFPLMPIAHAPKVALCAAPAAARDRLTTHEAGVVMHI